MLRSPHAPATDAADVPGRDELISHLDRICLSKAFRDSARCQQFLRHVVMLWMDGRIDDLKERVIGAELFSRTPSYSTSDDSIVRVRAREVRRRLSDYYREEGLTETVQLALPRGSYVPVIEHTAAVHEEPQETAALPPRRMRLPSWLLAAAAAMLVTLAAYGLYVRAYAPTPMERFWAPLLNGSRPTIINLGMSSFYYLDPRLAGELTARSAGRVKGDLIVRPGDLQYLEQDMVTRGTFWGIMDLARFLERRQKPFEMRSGADLTIEDLQQHSMVFVGAFSNPWTLDALRGLRFTFERSPSGDRMTNSAILDKHQPARRWSAPLYPHALKTDYALITRIIESNPQRAAIYVGGLSQYGTQAAAQFLTSPDAWEALVEKLPNDWANRDMQILLETAVVQKKPKPPKVLAIHTW